ncbi:MAG: hypothetical protein SPG61_06985 [Arcanobacterium sp.]|nr:hypothetical protein [Arcanobacterium sp.]
MASLQRIVILTPFGNPEIISKIIEIRKLAARTIVTSAGVAVVFEQETPEFTDWDIAELLGFNDADSAENTTLAENTAANSETAPEDEYSIQDLARDLSKRTEYGVVYFSADLGDEVGGESGVSGIVKAQRVLSGEFGEELPSGLLLNTLPDELETLIITGKIAK